MQITTKTKRIKLTQGKYAFIDEGDFELVSKHKWFYRKSGRTNGKNGYAETAIYNKEKYLIAKKEGHHRYNDSLFMHNLIMQPPKGMVVDHIDRNGLNNCRENLRVVTHSENYHNYPKKKGRSIFKGVHYFERLKNTKPWQSGTTVNGKSVYWGTFKTEIEAAKMYDKKIQEIYGSNAILNFPKK